MNDTTTNPRLMPPIVMLGGILLMLGFNFLFPIVQVLPGLWRLLGLCPLVFGVVISYVAEGQFRRAGTTVRPFDVSSVLVTDGLFHVSRNPMYLGMILILFGVALLLGNLTPFGVIPLFWMWISLNFIRREEQMLATQFGQDWLEYKTQVRRWI